MSSQKSMALPDAAVAPKRQRGRDRVEAILATASDLFSEKGFDAVTMTEIAQRSSTAIGSLYRFFPTKEVLAGVLLQRYGSHVTDGLDAIVAGAGTASARDIAASLVGLVRDLQTERSVVLPLIDVQNDGIALRQALRDAMRERLEKILARGRTTPPADGSTRAIVLLHLLKMAWALALAAPSLRDALEREVEGLIASYLG
ncbi:MAG: TetR/AcrR family transcriptional regulator [Telmatospirillum sp.]|nr:TetR/AcrR family transcriptional regulator [Telmatospirillum sp.]